jgi:hypothetical protein
MKAQQLEDRSAVKIKFASIGPGEFLVSDASSEEYAVLFQQAPDGWAIVEDGQISTRAEGSRRAWLLAKDGVEVAVVAHETGVEIVIGVVGTIAAGVAVDLAKDAVVGLTKWLWRRWKGLRSAKVQKKERVDSSLRLECNIVRMPGGSLTTVRLEVRAPLNDDTVAQCLTKFLTDYGLPEPPSLPHLAEAEPDSVLSRGLF